MADLVIARHSSLPSGELVAVGVSAEEYMTRYAHDFYEWVGGVVIKMPPVTDKHDDLTRYLRDVLDAYLSLNPIGVTRAAPFVMRLDAVPSRREPDLQLILNNSGGELTPTAMIGAADICIEVVSDESISRDYGDKFHEYEKGGVHEYWIVDGIRQEAHFYRLNEQGMYKSQALDADGNYTTPLLPKLKLHVPTLWAEPLPDILRVVAAVQAMMV